MVTTLGTFLVVLLVPAASRHSGSNAPLAGLAQHLAASRMARVLMAVALAGAAVPDAGPAAHAALGDAEQMLHRVVGRRHAAARARRRCTHASARPPAPSTSPSLATILVVLASGGRVAWLARAYAIAIAVMLVLTIAALARLRRSAPGDVAVQGARQPALRRPRAPLGLLGAGVIVAVSAPGDGADRRRRRRSPRWR